MELRLIPTLAGALHDLEGFGEKSCALLDLCCLDEGGDRSPEADRPIELRAGRAPSAESIPQLRKARLELSQYDLCPAAQHCRIGDPHGRAEFCGQRQPVGDQGQGPDRIAEHETCLRREPERVDKLGGCSSSRASANPFSSRVSARSSSPSTCNTRASRR